MPMPPDDPIIAKNKAKRAKKNAEEVKELQDGLTLAENLSVKAKEQVLKIPMKNSKGEFTIPVRLPTVTEMQFLITFGTKYQTAIEQGDIEALVSMGDEYYALLANLIQDDSITVDFLKSGNYAPEDMYAITRETLMESYRRVQKYRSFRDKPNRAGPVKPVSRTEKVSP